MISQFPGFGHLTVAIPVARNCDVTGWFMPNRIVNEITSECRVRAANVTVGRPWTSVAHVVPIAWVDVRSQVPLALGTIVTREAIVASARTAVCPVRICSCAVAVAVLFT